MTLEIWLFRCLAYSYFKLLYIYNARSTLPLVDQTGLGWRRNNYRVKI